jgi:transcriptional regulator with XRE-family HTH domain
MPKQIAPAPASLGHRLKEARLAAGFTQEGLARALNVSTSTVSRWERDEFTPEPRHLEHLARLLGGVPQDYAT